MRTRSQTRNRPQQQVPPNIEPFNLEEPIENQAPPVVTMADQRTMAQLLQAPTEGYEDAIVVPAITADNFELKHDSLNSAAGGNFLDKMPRDFLAIIESKSKVRYSRSKTIVAKVSTSSSTPSVLPDVAKLKEMVKALLLDKKNQSQAPATVKAVEESYVTCGGAHSYHNYPTTDGNVYHDNIQEYVSQAATVNYNQGNTDYRSCSLLSNTVANPRGDMKAIITQSRVSYDGLQVPPPPSSLPKVVEHEPEVTKDTVQPSTENIQLQEVQTQNDEPLLLQRLNRPYLILQGLTRRSSMKKTIF
ncbi:hypothetical protein Tco_0559584 [Tanacetum coccineum]